MQAVSGVTGTNTTQEDILNSPQRRTTPLFNFNYVRRPNAELKQEWNVDFFRTESREADRHVAEREEREERTNEPERSLHSLIGISLLKEKTPERQ